MTDDVLVQLEDVLPDADVTRVAGGDRYVTSARLAELVATYPVPSGTSSTSSGATGPAGRDGRDGTDGHDGTNGAGGGHGAWADYVYAAMFAPTS